MSIDVSKLLTQLSTEIEAIDSTVPFQEGTCIEITEDGAIYQDHGYVIVPDSDDQSAEDAERVSMVNMTFRVDLSFLSEPSGWRKRTLDASDSVKSLRAAIADITLDEMNTMGATKIRTGRSTYRNEEFGMTIASLPVIVTYYE